MTTSLDSHPSKSPWLNPTKPKWVQSQVKHDLIVRLGAANQQVAAGRSFEWLWLVANAASNQPAFAAMADPRPARPPHRNITSLGEFE